MFGIFNKEMLLVLILTFLTNFNTCEASNSASGRLRSIKEDFGNHQVHMEENNGHLLQLNNLPNCGEVKSSEVFAITSPNYPVNYKSNLDCVYRIQKFSPNVCGIVLSFRSFALGDDRACRHNYIEIEDQKFCHRGPKNAQWLEFDKPEILIRFHSDKSTSKNSFHIDGQQMTDCSATSVFRNASNCEEVRLFENFYISTPYYPGNYNFAVDCNYTIWKSSSDVCGLILDIDELDYNFDTDCKYVYLELQGRKYCKEGPWNPRRIPFVGSHLTLKFHSHISIPHQVFSFTGQQVTCD